MLSNFTSKAARTKPTSRRLELKRGLPQPRLRARSGHGSGRHPDTPSMPAGLPPPPELSLPLEGGVLTDGLNESFVGTFYHNKSKARIWRTTDLFRQNLQNHWGHDSLPGQSHSSADTLNGLQVSSPPYLIPLNKHKTNVRLTTHAPYAPAAGLRRAFQSQCGREARRDIQGALWSGARGPKSTPRGLLLDNARSSRTGESIHPVRGRTRKS